MQLGRDGTVDDRNERAGKEQGCIAEKKNCLKERLGIEDDMVIEIWDQTSWNFRKNVRWSKFDLK